MCLISKTRPNTNISGKISRISIKRSSVSHTITNLTIASLSYGVPDIWKNYMDITLIMEWLFGQNIKDGNSVISMALTHFSSLKCHFSSTKYLVYNNVGLLFFNIYGADTETLCKIATWFLCVCRIFIFKIIFVYWYIRQEWYCRDLHHNKAEYTNRPTTAQDEWFSFCICNKKFKYIFVWCIGLVYLYLYNCTLKVSNIIITENEKGNPPFCIQHRLHLGHGKAQ